LKEKPKEEVSLQPSSKPKPQAQSSPTEPAAHSLSPFSRPAQPALPEPTHLARARAEAQLRPLGLPHGPASRRPLALAFAATGAPHVNARP